MCNRCDTWRTKEQFKKYGCNEKGYKVIVKHKMLRPIKSDNIWVIQVKSGRSWIYLEQRPEFEYLSTRSYEFNTKKEADGYIHDLVKEKTPMLTDDTIWGGMTDG
jgi:hypothetical protein